MIRVASPDRYRKFLVPYVRYRTQSGGPVSAGAGSWPAGAQPGPFEIPTDVCKREPTGRTTLPPKSTVRDTQHRFARREDLGLSKGEFALLHRLSSPQKIQEFLNRIPMNHEAGGETMLSVREVIRQRHAHCMEGALLAACALWIQGETPVLMHLDCALNDYPHVIALFRRGKSWGAISKTNGAALRYRDPVYRTLRELAMSYFHEYCDKRGRKTLRSFSLPFDVRRLDPVLWVTNATACWETHDRLASLRHYNLISPIQQRRLSIRDTFERRVAKIAQYPKVEGR